MKKLLLIFVLFLLPSIANPLSLIKPEAPGLQLIAVLVDWCPYCNKWTEEVVPSYSNIVPLVIINATSGNNIPQWYKKALKLKKVSKLRGIPAFIIWDTEAEVELVRWVGYGGGEHFYEMLDKAINKALEKRHLCSEITSALERRSASACKAEKIR
tara:strand:- start:298 stop:765 length:468 start_codon:yes stop_codon:yes gene_type:complete